jgi:hypothetical protein
MPKRMRFSGHQGMSFGPSLNEKGDRDSTKKKQSLLTNRGKKV